MVRQSRKRQQGDAAPHVRSGGVESAVYNAGAYRRLSTDDKKKRGDSLETQQNIIENYAAASPDIRLVETYTDNNATGTNFERPGFQKMLADIESGKINCIIVKDLSRFGRNAIDAGYYLEKYLPTLGVRFIAITDSYDSLDGDAGILLPLKNIISESYALDISRKCRSVQRQNINEGRFVGRLAPYGYKKAPDDCHKLIPDEETAAIVRQMFDWACHGETVGDIVRRLGEEKIPTPGQHNHDKGYNVSDKLIGNPHWKLRTVVNILTDRVYVGDMVQGKTRTVHSKQVEVDPSEWVCVPNTHEPLVSREIFERVQIKRSEVYERAKVIQQNTTPYSTNVLKGKVCCARCGHPMHRHKQSNHDYYWYRCESQWKYGKNICVQVSVKESDLKFEILTLLYKHAETILGRYITFERDATAEKSVDSELREINGRLEKDGRMRQSLYENMFSGLITTDEYVQMKAEYEAKIAELSSRADEIRDIKQKTKAQIAEYYNTANAVSAALCDNSLTADIIERLVDKILVHPDKSFEIIFRFKDEFGEVLRCG